jgi:hypothetical protein
MSRSRLNASFCVPLLVSSLLAAPKIEFSTKTFQCGTVFEGKTEKLNAVFVVKNSGDLVIKTNYSEKGELRLKASIRK